MFTFLELTKYLPPLRDDEPPSLRQEIVDEILDHLQCSLRRELLLNGGDESSARLRVLDRFGDPAQIARQLWLQAMWSKIMSQRLMIGLLVASMLISAALAGLVGWLVVEHSRDSVRMQQHLAENADLMRQLIIGQSTPAAPQRDPNWNSLKIKVTLDNKDGPPAIGYTVYVSRKPRIGDDDSKTQNANSFYGTIRDTGVADCGYVGPGYYTAHLVSPWGEQSDLTFMVFPGQDHLEHCVAPTQRPELSKVAINVPETPVTPTPSQFVLICFIYPEGSRKFGDLDWSSSDYGWFHSPNLNEAPVIIPCFMFVLGQGIWVTESNPEFAREMEKQAKAAKWRRWDHTIELDLPEHQYVAAVSVFRLRTVVSPEDSKWAGIQWSRPAESQLQWQIIPGKFLAEAGKKNEWEVNFRETLTKVAEFEAHLKSNTRPNINLPATYDPQSQ